MFNPTWRNRNIGKTQDGRVKDGVALEKKIRDALPTWVAAVPAISGERQFAWSDLPIIVVFLAGAWCFFLFLLSLIGWRDAAREFAAEDRPTGESYRWRYGYFDTVGRYAFCLQVTLSETGLFVVPAFFLRLFHPPLFVPWSRLQQVHVSDHLLNKYELTFSLGAHQLTLFLPEKAGAAITRFGSPSG